MADLHRRQGHRRAEAARRRVERRPRRARTKPRSGSTSQLVARYFGLRLAAIVEGLRRSQLEQADRQLPRARRFEAQGQISAVERLSAQVSRDEVARDLVKAQRERESAEAALARMLRQTGTPRPTTPLFVVTSPIEPLAVWLREAELTNPTLALIKSKGEAADQGIAVAKADYLPQVFAFGQYNLITAYLTPIEPNWIAGIGVNFKLFSREDRPARSARRRRSSAQVDALRGRGRQRHPGRRRDGLAAPRPGARAVPAVRFRGGARAREPAPARARVRGGTVA